MKIAYVIIGAVAIAALAAAGGFFGGMTYAQSQAQNAFTNFAQQRVLQNQTVPQGGANNPCGFDAQVFSSPQGGAPGNLPSGAVPIDPNAVPGQQGNQQGRRQGQFGGAFGGFAGAQLGNCVARGQIKSVNGDTVEISTADSVVTVKVNDTTMITKTERGAISDLQVGDRVTVFSQETGTNPTASGIQLQRNLPPPTQ